jgi:PAS domain S-box-containing protein
MDKWTSEPSPLRAKAPGAVTPSNGFSLGLLDLVVDGVIVVDAKGEIRYANSAAEAIFGYPREQMYGAVIRALLPDLGNAVSAMAHERRSSHGGLLGVMWPGMGRHKDGSKMPVEIRFRWLDNGDGRLLAYLVREQVEEESPPEREPAPTQRPPLAARHGEPLVARHMADLSHELRTPLNAILGYAELLMEEVVEDGPDRFLPDLQRIQKSGKHLVCLVDTLLDISRIEAGRMLVQTEETAVASLIEDTLDEIRPLAERNGNELEVRVDLGAQVIRIDAPKVRQVLINLLSNACKFTESGTVGLEVQTRYEPEPSLTIRVWDTGIGMTPKEILRVFEPFAQASPDTKRRFGGTGLGLTICQKLAGLMGGRLDVRSEYGKGATFTVEIPLDEEYSALATG